MLEAKRIQEARIENGQGAEELDETGEQGGSFEEYEDLRAGSMASVMSLSRIES